MPEPRTHDMRKLEYGYEIFVNSDVPFVDMTIILGLVYQTPKQWKPTKLSIHVAHLSNPLPCRTATQLISFPARHSSPESRLKLLPLIGFLPTLKTLSRHLAPQRIHSYGLCTMTPRLKIFLMSF